MKDIEQLIDRFFDGETTNAEEQALYAFFNGETIPETLEKYKPVFRYFEQMGSPLNPPQGDLDERVNGRTDERTNLTPNHSPQGEGRSPSSCGEGFRERSKHGKTPFKRRWALTGIAASFAVIIGIGIYKHLNSKPFNPYEGSYIIRNGVKITDPQTIRPEIEKSLFRIALQNQIEQRQMKELETMNDF
ncbi:MAG: hypothetical protein LBE91_17720 [Tannerella sp.]|jgi:hypothetical protein|nr:hypothetical protein [Tannerella sp.]